MTKPIIVGIDFGTTTGLSIIDLNKKQLFTKSKKNFTLSNIKENILEFGKPVIIATDKKKVPIRIKKLASSFKCKVFNPKHDLSVDEKKDIIKKPTKDPHQRDSLAAALFAYKYYSKKFKHINKVLESKGLREYSNVVKEMIIQKEARNLSEAIEFLKPKRKDPVIQLTKEVNLDWKDQTEKRERELREEKKRNEIMKIYCEKLDEKIKTLERQKQAYIEEEMKKNETVRRSILKEKEITSRDVLIKQLKYEIIKKNELMKIYEEKIRIEQEEKNIIQENMIPVIIIPELSKEDIMEANKKFNIFNKTIFFENTKSSKRAIKTLQDMMPKIIIAPIEKDMVNDLKQSGIIVIDQIEMEKRDYFGAVSPENIKEVIRKIERKNFMNWLEEYKRR